MTPQRWERISELLVEVSRKAPEERDAYLRQVCADEGIRREVESLLANQGGLEFISVFSSAPGKCFRQYQIIEEIGRGSMGEVYKAHDMHLNRTVALKFVPSWVRGEPRYRARLIREAKAASALNHPNVVTVHELVQEQGVDFIVMEFVPGQTLKAAIPPKGLPADQALGYALQIAGALAAVHARGLLHNDLKPSNIMLTPDEWIKLLDFSVARAITPESSEPGKSEPLGTTAYMAPERIGARPQDARAEIFSFGVILHEMLSGRHPFGTGTADEITDRIRNDDFDELPTGTPAGVVDVVRRCLAKSPEDRPQSMEEVQEVLRSHPHDRGASIAVRSSADLKRVETLLSRISYANLNRSRQTLTELLQILEGGLVQAVRETVAAGLRDMILTLDVYPDGVPGPVRQLRKVIMEVFATAVEGHLSKYFANRDLEDLDLYGMDFAGRQLAGVSFRRCFLVEANFRASHLERTTFAGAWIRNSDFTDADLTGADFTDTDWFNALGLTEGQLGYARRETLSDCPADFPEMRRYLDARYGISPDAWPAKIREELNAAWTEHLRPRGLRDIVARWRCGSSHI